MSKKELKSFFTKADKAAETPTGGIPQEMEVVGDIEASATRRLSKVTFGNTLSYTMEKAQGKTTIRSLPAREKLVTILSPDHKV